MASTDVAQLKKLEYANRGKKYHFTFIGTITCFDDILDADTSQLKEELVDVFDLNDIKDIKQLKIEEEDDADQYIITCGYVFITTDNPNDYINDFFDEIVDNGSWEEAVRVALDLSTSCDIIRWEGKFKKLHQRDYKKNKKKNLNHSGTGLTQNDIDNELKRKKLIKQQKEKEKQQKIKRDKDKANKHQNLVKSFADNHYQYDKNYQSNQNNNNNNNNDDDKDD